MAGMKRSARALLNVSTIALTMSAAASAVHAQDAETLDAITVLATKTEEKAIDSLAAVSTVRQEQLDQLMPNRPSDVFFGVPGVSFEERPDDPATAINIRGLQDFGRVNVVIDGARQNFQRSGHNANGAFYLEPELLSGADVVRGPVANIYGSGAIGGVVSFQTKYVDDILRPGERWGVLTHGLIGTNMASGLGSVFVAGRPNPNIDLLAGGTYRSNSNYEAGRHGTVPAGAVVGLGEEVPNSGYDVATGIAKATARPADGHEVKISGLTYQADFTAGLPGSSIFDTTARNNVVTGRWRYSKPDDPLFDFDGNVYWTQTLNDQTKTCCTRSAITGMLGSEREFKVDTIGFDVNNTSRFDLGPIRNALTYGGDAFNDKVKVTDPTGTGALFTPNGERTVAGGFVQWKANYSTWLEVIGAARYDTFELQGGGVSNEGNRVSPKATVGVTPIQGFTVYGTYAEGYRAPAVTEALIEGIHPFPALFTFLPNPNLRPEIGKTVEGGINVKYDDVLFKGDRLRAKFNVFRNDVTDFIELTFIPFIGPVGPCPVPPFCFQYQNVTSARIEGVEFESMYDAGDWFIGLSAWRIRGANQETGNPLVSIPPDQIATTFGVRLLDRKLTASVRWAAVGAKNCKSPDPNPALATCVIPEGVLPTDSYNLVNLYLGYQVNADVLAGLSVENLLDEYYFSYLNAQTARLPSPGVTVKASLKMRLGG